MGEDNLADSMASNDAAHGGDGDMAGATAPAGVADSQERPEMQLQVVLDRLGFGPGVIDGRMGTSTANALKGFQEANDLTVTGELDTATEEALAEWQRIPATRVVTIPASWGELEFETIPEGAEEQAAMDRLGYESLDEKIAERFHTTVEVLQQLNPGGSPAGMSTPSRRTGASSTPAPSGSASASGDADYFTVGRKIRVPNIGADRIAPAAIENREWQQTLASLGVGSEQPDVARIVVDESEGWLKGYDADDKLVAMFTVTTGSQNDPLPIGEWAVNGVGYNPTFAYQPELFWDVPDSEDEQMLPPGPNGPVGVVWIDLTKEHYGIHGTPEPQTIGRTQSHGCVRLTNWDAARLAGMVSNATEVIFQA
ncbi:MAG: murein L,D-transpeptidase [Erythrobacter sp.]|nr:MAG: murein L,D-transpeptidase [Erythrobacter sp.]